MSLWLYWRAILKLLAIIIGSSYISFVVKNLIFKNSENLINFFIEVIISALIYCLISFCLFYSFDKGMRLFVKRLFSQILRKYNKV